MSGVNATVSAPVRGARRALTVELVVAGVQLAQQAQRRARRHQPDALPPEHLLALQPPAGLIARLCSTSTNRSIGFNDCSFLDHLVVNVFDDTKNLRWTGELCY